MNIKLIAFMFILFEVKRTEAAPKALITHEADTIDISEMQFILETTPQNMFGRTKLAFLQYLPAPTLQKLFNLRDTLNKKNGALDAFQYRLESLDHYTPDVVVPGFFNWLLSQEKEDVRQWKENMDHILKRIQHSLVLKFNLGQVFELLENNVSGKKSENAIARQNSEPMSDFMADVLKNYVKILWRVGPSNFYRLMELLQFIDQEGPSSLKTQFRLLSVIIGTNLGLDSGETKEKLVPEVADWILGKDPKTIGKWLEIGNAHLKRILKWIEKEEDIANFLF